MPKTEMVIPTAKEVSGKGSLWQDTVNEVFTHPPYPATQNSIGNWTLVDDKGRPWELLGDEVVVVTEDLIAHPNHYSAGMPEGISVIDVIRSQNGSWEHSNAIKYLLRAQYKGDYVQDLKKAVQYLTWAIERAELE